MRILITGGAGFIGLHLARILAIKNHEIVLFDNLSVGKYDDELRDLIILSKGKIKFQQGDLLKDEITIDPLFDLIIHLAGVIGTKDNQSQANTIVEDNFIMLKKIVNAIKGTKIKLIFASSQEIKYIPTEVTPRWFYAFSKLLCEVYLKSNTDINWNIVRFSNVWGSRTLQNYVIPNTKKRLLEYKDGEFPIYSPDDTRPFIYVYDVCLLINELINSDLNHETLDIGNPKSIKIKKLTEIMAKAFGVKPRFVCQKSKNVETRKVSMDRTFKLLGVKKFKFTDISVDTIKNLT